MTLSSPITSVMGIGDKYAQLLANLDIHTVQDLLMHFPARYEDWSQQSSLSQVQPGEKVTVQGQLISLTNIITRNGKKIQKAMISDNLTTLQVIWFNQTFLLTALKLGTWLSLSGKVDKFGSQTALISPRFERIAPPQTSSHLETLHTGKLISIYPETAGLSSNWLRAKIKYVLDHLDSLPDWRDLLTHTKLPPDLTFNQAIQAIHFPKHQQDYLSAQSRLADDELISIHLEALLHRQQWQTSAQSHPIQTTLDLTPFLASLPFKLTAGQQRALDDIVHDLALDKPANRLIQGDVGSGKTVIAAAAVFLATKSGFQTALMAPTEILAQQHYDTFSKFLSPLGIRVALQTGRIKHVKPGADDPFDVLIGTHALLSEIVNFDRLALVIIDEQHRFGVEQRSKLINKGQIANLKPHLISMTATPIPRTIALTLYGDLDITVIDELPPGRQIVDTKVVPAHKRTQAYKWIQSQIDQLHTQAFIVCPFIEVSETNDSVKSAIQEYEALQKIFPQLRLGLLHGGLSGQIKDQVLNSFQTQQLDILVTTPVVEVGVDIPNATVMLIEGAERFGLAQLHQLRGRVGRGNKKSYCFLFTSDPDQSSSRLKSLETSHNGMALAELDLKLRGPGQLYGTAQHGFVNLKLASYSDAARITRTHTLASQIFHNHELSLLNNSYLMRKIQHIAPN